MSKRHSSPQTGIIDIIKNDKVDLIKDWNPTKPNFDVLTKNVYKLELDPVRKTKLEGDGISLDNLSIVHLVAFYDSIECFCSFFSKKSDIVNQKNPKEFTPFHFALIGGSIHILSFLFSMYNLKDFTMPPRVDQKNNFSFITLAILSGSAQCVQLLLEFGALPNQDDLGFLSKQLLLYKDDSTEFKQPGRISFHTFIQVKEKSKKDKGETILWRVIGIKILFQFFLNMVKMQMFIMNLIVQVIEVQVHQQKHVL